MGRTIVITGGTSGIGLALKELFEKNGDTVLTFSLDETGDANHYQGSVDHEIKVRQVFNDIHERFSTIDMLINCAGIGMSGITELLSTEKIMKLTEVNYYGTLYCVRSALPFMERGARIINISSAMALFPVPFRSIYGSVKSAVLNFSFSLRMELAQLGIDVTAMCPGDTKTNFTNNRIKNFDTNERYGDLIQTATEKKDAKEDKKLSVTYVAEKIFKFANAKKTRPYYIIGGKYKFLHFLTRFTSKNLLLKMTGKLYGGKLVANEKKVKTPKEKVAKVKEEKVTPNTPVSQNIENNTTIENNKESVAPNTAPAENTSSSISQETAKNNINSILSKITILNKPSDQNTDNNN